MKCIQCGKEFDSVNNTKFCSDDCSLVYSREYHYKWNEAHPNVERDYVKSGARAFNNIKQRCNNPSHCKFPNYGARGIKLLLTFDEFISIYFRTNTCENCGEVLNDTNRNVANGRTLDRIDQAKSYEIGNLRILCRSCNCSFAYHRRNRKV